MDSSFLRLPPSATRGVDSGHGALPLAIKTLYLNAAARMQFRLSEDAGYSGLLETLSSQSEALHSVLARASGEGSRGGEGSAFIAASFKAGNVTLKELRITSCVLSNPGSEKAEEEEEGGGGGSKDGCAASNAHVLLIEHVIDDTGGCSPDMHSSALLNFMMLSRWEDA